MRALDDPPFPLDSPARAQASTVGLARRADRR